MFKCMFRGSLRPGILAGLAFAGLAATVPAYAHFQMLIPSDDMVSSPAERHLRLDIKFWHPFEGHGMSIESPTQFGVHFAGKNIDLRNTLQAHQFMDKGGKNRDGFIADYEDRKSVV